MLGHHSFCQNIVAVMGGNWGEKSLQDLEDYKNGLANELQLQPFLAQIHMEAEKDNFRAGDPQSEFAVKVPQ